MFTVNSSTSDSPDLYDIQYTPRFGYVPQMTTDFPNGNQTVNILRFRAIFLQRLLGACSANNCNTDFEPGLEIDKSSVPAKATEITAFIFPLTCSPTVWRTRTRRSRSVGTSS